MAPAGDVPTPWMTFQDDLQRAGLDPAAIGGHRFTERGDIAYTTFYATRRFTRARRDACHRLVRSMARAQAALFAATPRTIAEAVSPFLPKLDREALVRIIGAYRAAGL